jgi:hypothetical protein
LVFCLTIERTVEGAHSIVNRPVALQIGYPPETGTLTEWLQLGAIPFYGRRFVKHRFKNLVAGFVETPSEPSSNDSELGRVLVAAPDL